MRMETGNVIINLPKLRVSVESELPTKIMMQTPHLSIISNSVQFDM